MNHPSSLYRRLALLRRARLPLIISVVAAATLTSFAFNPVPQNLVNGLDQIVSSNVVTTADPTKAVFGSGAVKFATQAAANFDAQALKDTATGRYVVEIMPNGRVPVATLQSTLASKFASLTVTAIDQNYMGHGVLEGYLAVTDMAGVANTPGVGSVILQLKPIHSAGATTSQGVNQHRVNKVNSFYNALVPTQWDGSGMSIGVMSDSFDSQPSEEGGTTNYPADQASGDLPGPANVNNTLPVVVLQDYNPTPGATNEGRGMCQIVHDVAPKARIGFATADVGEVGFANNIRALGGLPGFTKDPAVQQGFKGDVVCDDVSYLDEPMFQDGIVAQGVNDVVAAGVTYASSAANNWSVDGYESDFRPVANGSGVTAATNAALANTNINLTGADPSLYAGGFHNFNPNGMDVAQTINSSNNAKAAIFQWNDPYDTSAPQIIEPPIYQADGQTINCSEQSYQTPSLVAGQAYVIQVYATPPNPNVPPEDFDAIVRLTDPNGKVVTDQDTGTDEVVTFFAPANGVYTITVHPFAANPPVCTQGHYHLKLNNATGTSKITQDFNLLFFDMSGNFKEAIAASNFVNNRPYELWVPDLSSIGSQVQLVISRSNATSPAGSTPANRLKYVFFGNGLTGVGPAEYFDYLMPVTFGHSAAAGANSVAAYAAFRPNIPEEFTSPGPVTIYFDSNGNRLSTPQVRQKPDIAATDGVNNTFFPLGIVPVVGDSQYDADDFPNFYGTSAASPHCAALAALVLQAHKPAVLSPAQVKTILQQTAWSHDLDPFYATGSATAPNGGVVTVSARQDNSTNAATGSNDPNAISVTYNGPGYVSNIAFNPEGDNLHAGNTSGGSYSGLTDADFLDSSKYAYTPGLVWVKAGGAAGTNAATFKFGSLTTISGGSVVASYANQAPPPGTPDNHYWTLNLAFPNNNFTSGNMVRFNNGRAIYQDATPPAGGPTYSALRRSNEYSADLLGGTVLIPEDPTGASVAPGMSFRATVVDGGNTYQVNGRLANNIGHGWTPLDGYGFINAEAAVSAPIPQITAASRKVHGGAGTFDLPLNLANTVVEPRTGGTKGDYQIVFTFPNALTGVDGATSSAGSVSSSQVGSNAREYIVNITGITAPQNVTVTLNGAHEVNGNTTPTVGVTVGVLPGDVNYSKSVDGNDVSAVQSKTRTPVSNSTFQFDVNCTGGIDGNDVSFVQSKTRTRLP